MFTLLTDLLNELFASRPFDVEPNSKPLAMSQYQSKLNAAFFRLCPPTTSTTLTAVTKKQQVAPTKYQRSESPAPVDSGLDFSL